MDHFNYNIKLDQKEYKISTLADTVYIQAIEHYHIEDDIYSLSKNIYHSESLHGLLYLKCWIDSVQWHLEDEIRKNNLDPLECLIIKRGIDKSNQDRTNIVELIDDYFLQQYMGIKHVSNAKLNTESPAWALDRLSILNLKIYHMKAELIRTDSSPDHYASCSLKLKTLIEQHHDLCQSIDELHYDISIGLKQMKVYRQMKMYNDPNLNPVIYKSKFNNGS